MQPSDAIIEPEKLLRDAISSVAVTAYAHGITVFAHVDNRMPSGLLAQGSAPDRLLREGLLRTIRAGHTRNIAVTLWLTGTGPDGQVEAMLEVCRALEAGASPAAHLADLWTLAGAVGQARPSSASIDPLADAAEIPLVFTAVPSAAPVGARWHDVLRGRRLLHVGGVLFDHERLRSSMGVLGAEVTFTDSPDQAMAELEGAAADGRPFDVLVLNGLRLGPGAYDLARRVRAASGLASTRLVLASGPREAEMTRDVSALFDILPWAATPWRRLMDMLAELFREGDEAALLGAGSEAGLRNVPDLSGRRILIAEDVATNQVMLRAALGPTGAEVEVVGDGAALVERHRADPADLILVDLQMPGVGGLEAVRRIRTMKGAAAKVRVIAQTAHAREADRKAALGAGMDAFVVKPIVMVDFYALLNGLLTKC